MYHYHIVRCENCSICKYCPSFVKMKKSQKKEDRILGCTEGSYALRFLPGGMAKKFLDEIDEVVKKCDLDREKYIEDILVSLKKLGG